MYILGMKNNNSFFKDSVTFDGRDVNASNNYNMPPSLTYNNIDMQSQNLFD